MILRDFETEVLEDRGRRLEAICAGLEAEEPRLDVEVEIESPLRRLENAVETGSPVSSSTTDPRRVPVGWIAAVSGTPSGP